MARGNWRCGMCAASNESSTHVCIVCETLRCLGTRGGSGAAPVGDLLAPSCDAQEAFRAPRRATPDAWRDEKQPSEPVGRALGGRSEDAVPGPRRAERPGPSPSMEPLPRFGPEHGVAQGRSWFTRPFPGTWRALALASSAAVVLVGAWMWLPGDDSAEEGAESAAPPVCPERVAELIPGGGEGVLVESYRTERHRIVLCSDGVGQLHYFGELLDGSGEEMVLRAERTEGGYLARAGETVYEIDGTLVVIEIQGEEPIRYDLEEAPPPR